MNFEINFIFLIKTIFLHGQKVKAKIQNLENEKSFLEKIRKIFHISFKGLSLFWKVTVRL